MRYSELEHLIRATGAIAEVDHIIVIGSQAILASIPEPPAELAESIEADLYPRYKPEAADLIDGSIGELSMFHENFGYYAHGVGPETATLPKDWEERLVPLCNANTRGITGWCLAPIDIAFSKLVAGREKDMRFVRAMLASVMIKSDEIKNLFSSLSAEMAQRLSERLIACLSTDVQPD